MKRNVIAASVAAAALLLSTSALEAQRPVSIGLAAGATMPMGDFGDFADVGFHVMGTADINMPAMPVGLRFDLGWHQLGVTDLDENWQILALTGNVRFAMPGIMARPYFLLGGGWYQFKVSGFDGSEDDFGFNLGAGVDFQLAGFGTFGEIRYHHVLTEGEATQFIPISFGIKF